jgi:hypothetical protein
MRKKVIAIVIDTPLTNEQIEKGPVRLSVYPDPENEPHGETADARNVRVLDSDEITPSKPDALAAIKEALNLMNSMIKCGEKHSTKSESTLVAARAALFRLGA